MAGASDDALKGKMLAPQLWDLLANGCHEIASELRRSLSIDTFFVTRIMRECFIFYFHSNSQGGLVLGDVVNTLSSHPDVHCQLILFTMQVRPMDAATTLKHTKIGTRHCDSSLMQPGLITINRVD